jgi:NADPH:quinone reductase-like Zn-dependent oxidoreductase
MKAWMRERYGGPEVLELREVATPDPAAGEVLVRVHASSVNAADLDYLYGRPFVTKMGTGLRVPRNKALGLDIAGTVEAVGEEVNGVSVGDEVFGDLTTCGYGAFAEYAIATEKAIAPKPASLSFEEAATVPQSGILAIQALHAWRPTKAGDAVLVNGASGNVGPFAVAIAKAYGGEVTGVCSSGKMDFVRSLGTDDVIDYTKEDYAASGRQWDRIVDVAAHRGILASRRALKSGGVYAWAGGDMRSLAGAMTVGPLLSLVTRKRSSLFSWKPFDQGDIAELTRLIEAGTLRPVIDRTYSLAEVPDALRYLDEKRSQGKLVITV